MTEAPHEDLFALEVERVRSLLDGEGRSDNLLRLFNFLVVHSNDARAPKEIEIAFEVFGKDVDFDTSQDAMVRVYVYRLRSRLDAIYEVSSGTRLSVPKGEYRIALVDEADPQPLSESPVVETAGWANWSASKPRRALSRGSRLAVLAAVAFIGTALAWGIPFYLRANSNDQSTASPSILANAEKHCGSPALVVGDTYLYFQSGPGGKSPRLVMRPSVPSAAQLDTVLPGVGMGGARVRDRDDYYLWAGDADGLWSLMRAFSVRENGQTVVPPVVPMSKFTANMLSDGDIVYFGRLDQLGMLHDLVFQASEFTFDPESDTLRDSGNRREFKARLTAEINRSDRNPFRRPAFDYDYGYLAQIAKPDGCTLWVIAALEDSALPPMVRIALDPSQIKPLRRHSGGATKFEALYEIKSLGALKHESRRLLVHSLEHAR